MFGPEGDGNGQFCSHSAQSPALFLLAGTEAEYPRHLSDPSAIGRCACLLPMNYSREESLFALALEKPAEKRAAFLDAMCEGDAGWTTA